MAENIDYGYDVIVYTEGSVWTLRTNDVFVRENGDVSYASYKTEITEHVQDGNNLLSLLFSPLTGQNATTGDYNWELTDGVLIDLAVQRINYRTQEREQIDAVRIRYDTTSESFVSLPSTTSGSDRVFETANMRTNGQFSMTDMPKGQMVFRSGETVAGYRLDIDFTTTAPDIPPFHWTDDAVALQDTPELRAELFAAYQNIHNMITTNNGEAVFEAAEPVWDRSATLLTSNTQSARAFVEASGVSVTERFAATDHEGNVLQPLVFWGTHQDASIQFMADNRLVRFRPNPIAWQDPEGGPLGYREFPVVFYKNAAGEWGIAAILTGA